jgi:hypothetical protein
VGGVEDGRGNPASGSTYLPAGLHNHGYGRFSWNATYQLSGKVWPSASAD